MDTDSFSIWFKGPVFKTRPEFDKSEFDFDYKQQTFHNNVQDCIHNVYLIQIAHEVGQQAIYYLCVPSIQYSYVGLWILYHVYANAL